MTRKFKIHEGLLLFVFLLSSLLLLTRAEFWRSDGHVEYRVASRLVLNRAVDLPSWRGSRDHTVQLGKDGKLFSQFGLGHSLLYAATILADRFVIQQFNLTSYEGVKLNEPFFFSISVNALVLALIGLCLFTLLRDFKISLDVSLFATVLYVFGTMALIYSQLSFDMPLSVLATLATFLFLFRATDRGKSTAWLFAGLCFGFSLVTRANNVIFFLPIVLYILFSRRSGRQKGQGGDFLLVKLDANGNHIWSIGLGGTAWLRGALIFFAGWISLSPLFFYYNYHRYGSAFSVGYNRPGFPFKFNASWLESIPSLLLSPGRSMFVFAPPLLLSVLGLGRFVRHDYKKASALLLAAAVNFLFFSKWSFWMTPYTWGPRFQLLVVTLMFVPVAFWLQANWRKISSRFKLITWPVFALCVTLQMAAALTGFDQIGFKSSQYWQWSNAQALAAVGQLWNVMRWSEWDTLRLWWTTPVAQSLGMRLLFLVLVVATVVSLIALWRVRRMRWP